MNADAFPPQEHPAGRVIPVRRRTIDLVLVAAGALATIVLVIAGSLLMWGQKFSTDYVRKELSSQHITFPTAEVLTTENRTDLLAFASKPLADGKGAQAYASYIDGHLEKIADGATYADLGGPERTARAAAQAAVESGAPQATIDDLQTASTGLTAQRDTMFKGETLRGLLLSAYAWSTVGRIAGIAAVASLVSAALMLVLVGLGVVHFRRSAVSVGSVRSVFLT